MIALQSSTPKFRDRFPGGTSMYLLFKSDIVNFLLKFNVGDTEGLIFIVIFVVLSA